MSGFVRRRYQQTVLDVLEMDLTELPLLGEGLEQLYCQDIQLTTLPDLPDSLTILNCDNNVLTSLSNLPNLPKLTQLFCNNNQLRELPSLPNSLKILECEHNLLTELPVLLPNLESLVCGGNKLASLPVLPDSLEYLTCNDNKLTVLPDKLSEGLTLLKCDNNKLEALPALPDGLTHLICNNNKLTVLPVLPRNLRVLSFSGNKITQIDSDLTSLNIYVELDTNNLNLASLIKYANYLTRLVNSKILPPKKIETILRNIETRKSKINSVLVFGPNRELRIKGIGEVVPSGPVNLINSYIEGGKKSRKAKKSRNAKKSRKNKK